MSHRINIGDCCLRFVQRGDVGRNRLEDYIHAAYAKRYGADIRDFMPLLIGLETAEGTLQGVLGLREAAHESLLLENYLDVPVEEAISHKAKCKVRRSGIVELGNLATGSPGAARILVVALNAYLQGADFDWVVLTAVPVLRNTFRRLDLNLLELASADGKRLGDAQRAWGSYYDHMPSVVAGNVDYGFQRLHEHM